LNFVTLPILPAVELDSEALKGRVIERALKIVVVQEETVSIED